VKRTTPKEIRREIFVLTPEERRTLCLVLVAFVLGFATKHYRDAHPIIAPKTEINARANSSPRPAQTHETKHPRSPR
jgi:hypothetical protein